MTAITDYNDIIKQASEKNDAQQETGDTWNAVSQKFEKAIHEVMAKAEKAGWKEYYIWLLISKDPVIPNVMKLTPFGRRTRPSPNQSRDHFLWKYSPSSGLSFEWSAPSVATSEFVVKNPDKFPPEYVHMMKKWRAGTLV